MRPRLKKTLRIVVYLVFLALCAEIVLQAYYYFTAGATLFSRTSMALYRSAPYGGYRVKANLVQPHNTNEFRTTIYTNSKGFRVSSAREEFSYERTPGVYRILLLGPSFAFGWGVKQEESFAARLQSLLEEHGPPEGERVEVINAGVPGSGPPRMLEWYEHEGKRYSPDLVVQFLYGSMALSEPRPESDVLVDERGNLVPAHGTRGQWLRHHLKRSALVFYSWMVYTQIRSATDGSEARNGVQGAGRELELVEQFRLDDPAVQRTLGLYRRFAESTQANGSRLLFVFIPLSYAVHPEDEPRWAHLGVRDIRGQRAFNEAFCRYLGKEGIPCIDLTSELLREAATNGDRLYYWLDIHWTPRGNQVAARAVAERLRSRSGGS